MHLTEEQLSEIQNMASLFFAPEEIALNIEVDPDDFLLLILSKTNPAWSSYMAGRLGAEIELRRSIQQSALHGSTPAQQMMRDWHNQSRHE
jgi:hypothetical protein